MTNNFLITSALSRTEIESLFDLALQYKTKQISDKPLSGKSFAHSESNFDKTY